MQPGLDDMEARDEMIQLAKIAALLDDPEEFDPWEDDEIGFMRSPFAGPKKGNKRDGGQADG